MPSSPNSSQVILPQAADGQVSLDVHLEAATVWLSQTQMAELFGRERSVISKHIGNVFKGGRAGGGVNLCKICTCSNGRVQGYSAAS
jgi:hypothetical protein